MANTPDYSWPPMEKRQVIGKPYKRLDGPQKASGRAKYCSDLKPKDLLFGVYLTSPHAHARVTSIDTSAAEKTAGVKAVHVVSPAGTEIQWAGTEIAAVAATTEEIARDAVRKIKVDYEVLPHLVKDEDLSKAGARAKAAGEKLVGDPDKAFQEAEAVSEGQYGIPVVTHCCLETHGQVIQWQGDQVNVWPSTQDVTHYAGSLAPNIKVPIANIHVKQDHIGGGFGSKFAPDSWGEVGASLSQKAGGRPVKLFLDRATDQMIAGNRPSAYAKIKIAGKKDGTVTAWQSESWATGGFTGGGSPPLPYIIDTIPNQRLHHTAVAVNAGPNRAWRAPNNQQASYLTCSALEDFAAKIGMDPHGSVSQECRLRPQRARGDIPVPVAEGRRDRGLEEAVASARAGRLRPGEARSGPRLQRLGRRRAPEPVPHHHQPGWLGAGGNRHPGPGHRDAHHHHPGGGRDAGASDGRDQAGDRVERPAAGQRLGRVHHRGRRFLFHAQGGGERARQAVRSGRAGAGRAARTVGGGGRPHPREGQSQQEPHLAGRLPQAGDRQDLRNGREQPAQSQGPQHLGRRRHSDGRRLGGYGDGAGQDQPLCGRAGLRA